MKTVLAIILFLYFSSEFVYTKLILAHVLFRHGERTSDGFTMYPKDPYKNESFYPYGAGQMTNEGKKTIFNLGKELRNRYGDFISDIYTPDVLDPWASYLPRTQMALQLLLASLFPPKGFQVWETDLPWQPIPYNFFTRKNDSLLLGILDENFKRTYYEYCQSNAAEKAMKKAEPFFPYIRKHAGVPGKTPREFFFLYVTLDAESQFGLKLPKWTERLYPQPLIDLVSLEYHMQLATNKLKQQAAGQLIEKILTDTENKISGKSKHKLHLYSAHDINIAHVLIILDLMYTHSPNYGACLILEIHEENQIHFIKVFYRESKTSDLQLLKFSKGEDRMHLDKYRNIVSGIYGNEQTSVASMIRQPVTCLQILFVMLCCCYKYLYVI